MAAGLTPLSRVLEAGAERGVFAIEDPDFAANHVYAQVLGTMHLAQIGAGVHEAACGVPAMFRVDPERVRPAAVDDVMALALGGARAKA